MEMDSFHQLICTRKYWMLWSMWYHTNLLRWIKKNPAHHAPANRWIYTHKLPTVQQQFFLTSPLHNPVNQLTDSKVIQKWLRF